MRIKILIIKLIFLFPLLISCLPCSASPSKCVQIYYDYAHAKSNDKPYYTGRLYSIFLQNLLGHFPDIQPYIIPIDLYQKGQIERCQSSIYLGTYYNNPIPQAFLDDFVNTKKNVAWINYNIWQLDPSAQKKVFNALYVKLISTPDWTHLDAQGIPTFFRYFDYKGETFTKYVIANPQSKQITNNVEINFLSPLNNEAEKSNVIAWARQTTPSQKIPYIIRDKNHWYIADNPFTHTHEGSPYAIFSDVLFDIVDEKPQENGKKYALIRIEDIHPYMHSNKFYRLIDIMVENKIPFSIALTPMYKDPLKYYKKGPKNRRLLITEDKQLITALHYAQTHGGSIILHGVTHQYDKIINPYTGVTGDDYEFWDTRTNSPVAEDSPQYIFNRLHRGFDLINPLGLKPVAWDTPYYTASALDYTLFGELFSWNIGRVKYTLTHNCQEKPLPENLTLDNELINHSTDKKRRQYFKNMKINSLTFAVSDYQTFPYIIYRDYYGQRIIPENLGEIIPYINEKIKETRTTQQIIEDAKRNLVLRDTWASFYIHPTLLNTKSNGGLADYPGDTAELSAMIKQLKQLGYQFVDLKQWSSLHLNQRPPAPILAAPINPCSAK